MCIRIFKMIGVRQVAAIIFLIKESRFSRVQKPFGLTHSSPFDHHTSTARTTMELAKITGMYAEPLNTTSTMSRIIPRASPAAIPTMRRLIVRSSNIVTSTMFFTERGSCYGFGSGVASPIALRRMPPVFRALSWRGPGPRKPSHKFTGINPGILADLFYDLRVQDLPGMIRYGYPDTSIVFKNFVTPTLPVHN